MVRLGRPRLLTAALVVLGVVIALLAMIALGGNLLRGPAERYVSARLDRPFTIDGDLRISLWPPLGVSVERVAVGNASGFVDEPMLTLERGAVRLSLAALLRGRVELHEVVLDRPRVLLARDASGRANWRFGEDQDTRAREESPLDRLPAIGRLHIEGGEIRYRDEQLPAAVDLSVATDESSGTAPGQLRIEGSGTLRKESFALAGVAANPVSLAEAAQPFPLRLELQAGKTQIAFDGEFVPADLTRIAGRVRMSGADMSELHPMVPVQVPWTPEYSLAGELTRAGPQWTLRQLEGRVGNSDLAGTLALEQGKRPFLRGEVVSRRLDYRDLGGFVGLPPGGTPAQAASAKQRQEAERRARGGRALPDKAYDLQALRRLDADVHFRGERFTATTAPLEKLDLKLELRHGVLALRPIEFGIAGGRVSGTLVLDARERIARTDVDLTVRNVDLNRLVPALKPPQGRAGQLSGRARLDATGNSVAHMLATLDGDVALMSAGGTASALTLVLTYLDLARAARFLVTGDENAAVHCVVMDAQAKQGVVTLRTLVADTEVASISGEGRVDLRNETYDLRLAADSKQPTLALQGPIVITGTFRDPSIRPAAGPLAARAGAAVALGVLATPIAALLPLIDPGLAEDSDCGKLIRGAEKNVTNGGGGRAAR